MEYQKHYWKKRCTVRWTKFGDENSKFFQAFATERYKKNYIASLVNSDGIVVSNHEAKEKVIFDAYKERLGSCSNPPMLFDLGTLIEPVVGLNDLSAPFTIEEIDQVLLTMPCDKARGPDGLMDNFSRVLGTLLSKMFTKFALIFIKETETFKASIWATSHLFP